MQEENTNIKKIFPMNEEILKKLGYNTIALEMLLKREAQISPEDIIMPGQKPRLNIDSSFDSDFVRLTKVDPCDKTFIDIPFAEMTLVPFPEDNVND